MENEQNFDRAGEYSRKSRAAQLFARFFNRNRDAQPEEPIETQEVIVPEKPVKKVEKPDYWHPTVLKMEPKEIAEILSGINIEQTPSISQEIRYVGNLNADTVINPHQSFSEYAKENNLNIADSIDAVFRYTGNLTQNDFTVMAKLLAYTPKGSNIPNKEELLSTMSPAARTFMETNAIPSKMLPSDAWRLSIGDDQTPVSRLYNLNLSSVPSSDKMTAFWIGETFGGTIGMQFGPFYPSNAGGPMADGAIDVKLRSKTAGLLYINSFQTNMIQWAVDPFIRSQILNEDEQRVVLTAG